MNTNSELQKAVESYANGDKESFNQIYELSYQYLHTCVIHVVKDEDIAMDMLQETYLEISKSISQLKNKEGFLSWAATIANRKCYAYLKKQKDVVLYANTNEEETDDFFENIADDEEFIPETVLQDREKQRLIKEIIDGLTDIQRLCVIGFYYNEQKQEEIAVELGIPVNTVKSHLNRAKVKIKEAVVELDEKKGTRLYSMAPFMLLLFKEEVQACVLKPMTTALASAVGVSATAGATSGIFAETIAKIKALWVKVTTVGKTKAIIGVVAGTVTVAGVVTGLQEIKETYVISDELKTVYQEIMEVCKGEDLSDLCEIDYSPIRQQKYGEQEADEYWKRSPYIDINENLIADTVFFDGINSELVKDYTGYGLGIQGRVLTIAEFKKGKIQGEAVVIQIQSVSYMQDGEEIHQDDIQVTVLKVENGKIIDDVVCTWYYGDKESFREFTGEISYVEYEDALYGFTGKFYVFTGPVKYVCLVRDYNSDGSFVHVPQENVIYLDEKGNVDRTRNTIVSKGDYESVVDNIGNDIMPIPNLYMGNVYKLSIPVGKEYIK